MDIDEVEQAAMEVEELTNKLGELLVGEEVGVSLGAAGMLISRGFAQNFNDLDEEEYKEKLKSLLACILLDAMDCYHADTMETLH